MSIYQNSPPIARPFHIVRSSFLLDDGQHFAKALPEERIAKIFAEEGVDFANDEDNIFTPAVTLWAWLSQVLNKGEHRSCLAAVSRVALLLVALGRKPCAKNSGAYCRARAKLPEAVIRRLAKESAVECERAVPKDWLVKGRRTLLIDGLTATMPDTVANQAEYPQNVAQKPGLGFPIVRMVVLLSFATAMVRGMALGPYAGKETGETALFRELLDDIDPNTLLIADRYYCGYFLIAMAMLLKKCDIVTRLHQRRLVDFKKAKKLGDGDFLVEWQRPAQPDWMDDATYATIPPTLTVRLVKVEVKEPGFRDRSFWAVTTLTDASQHSSEEIADLYRRRWHVELDIRAIKKTMGMDVLSCVSPAMVRSEIWTCLLGYNLIRKAMLEAAHANKLLPRTLSFAAAKQTIATSFELLVFQDGAKAVCIITAQIASLADQRVGDRPNRVEPRAVKRRPNPIALLTKPRNEARADLISKWQTMTS
jgi:DDE family transposase